LEQGGSLVRRLFLLLACLLGLPGTLAAAPAANELVWSLQTSLRELGLYNGLINGLVGSDLTDAIAAMERELGAPVTGESSVPALSLVERLRVQRARQADFERLFDPGLIESLAAEEFAFFVAGLSADEAFRVFERYPERIAELPAAAYLPFDGGGGPSTLRAFLDAALVHLAYPPGEAGLRAFQRDRGRMPDGALSVRTLRELLEGVWLNSAKPILPESAFALRVEPTFVTARGSWEDLVGSAKLEPLNAVTIECFRDLEACFVAQASVSPAYNRLGEQAEVGARLGRFDIQRWSEQEIAATRVSPSRCTITGLTINFLAEDVFQSARNNDVSACVEGVDPRLDNPMIWKLVDGRAQADAYWRDLAAQAVRYRKP